jgi:hypothetical protein
LPAILNHEEHTGWPMGRVRRPDFSQPTEEAGFLNEASRSAMVGVPIREGICQDKFRPKLPNHCYQLKEMCLCIGKKPILPS